MGARHPVLRRQEAAAATPRLRAFTVGSFFTAGGTAALLTTAPAWRHGLPSSTGTMVLVALAITAFATGVGLLRWGHRLPLWAVHGTVASASLMLAAGVVLSADDVAAMGVASIFVFCAVDVLYFFAGWPALAQVALLLSAVAGSLAARGVGLGVIGALLLVQAAVVVVIGRLVERASQGTRDSLTGLLNRRGLDERLEAAVVAARRGRSALSVALVDVDRFKAVNDGGGHAAGDALLRDLAAVAVAAAPPGAVVARQGGDEFVLLAPGLTAGELVAVCERLRAAAPIGLSVGVAELEGDDDAGSLVRRADGALYAAKASGRGRTRSAGAGPRTGSAPPVRDAAAALGAATS